MDNYKVGSVFVINYPYHWDDNINYWRKRTTNFSPGKKYNSDGIGTITLKILSIVKTPKGLNDRVVTVNFFTDPSGQTSSRWVNMSTYEKFNNYVTKVPIIELSGDFE